MCKHSFWLLSRCLRPSSSAKENGKEALFSGPLLVLRL